MLTPTNKMIAISILAIIFFILWKKKNSKFLSKLSRINDFISLTDREYRRLKVLLSSDCSLVSLVSVKVLEEKEEQPKTSNSKIIKPKSEPKSEPKVANIKECVDIWFEKNHLMVGEHIANLSEKEIYTLQLQKCTQLPPKECWKELCQKLYDEWNVSYDICGDELHISWYQI